MLPIVVFSVLLSLGPFLGAMAQDGPEGCVAASCTTFEQINTLYCHVNPARFCQCRPTAPNNEWALEVMTCPEPETVFSFRHQVCVHPSMRDEAECKPSDDAGQGENVVDDGTLGCEAAPCETFEEINTLTCHPDRTKFCQCEPISTQPDNPDRALFEAVAMPCAEGTAFSFEHQTCTREELWVNSCP